MPSTVPASLGLLSANSGLIRASYRLRKSWRFTCFPWASKNSQKARRKRSILTADALQLASSCLLTALAGLTIGRWPLTHHRQEEHIQERFIADKRNTCRDGSERKIDPLYELFKFSSMLAVSSILVHADQLRDLLASGRLHILRKLGKLICDISHRKR